MDGPCDILALIPARGGSKGIPRKNIALLGGRPLLEYTVRAALACPSITRVVVSTDDAEIAEVARACGAEVPFLRPATIAGDRSDIGLCVRHALEFLAHQGCCLDHVVELYPTSPFRTPAFLEECIAPLLEGCQKSLVARRFPSTQRFYAPAGRGAVARLGLNVPAGSYFLRPYGLFLGRSLRAAPWGCAVRYLENPIMEIDIDTPEDLLLAESVIANGLFDFGLP
ncbi:MAG: hypothetical protein AUJ49_01180 [Desulfovibrionaceae bacterium CG1_02_65_16]|nr:MAG: hypothetical protein AUJ49_01180 [Desulfovibrionaceae bacterium CG1_02_65_16]